MKYVMSRPTSQEWTSKERAAFVPDIDPAHIAIAATTLDTPERRLLLGLLENALADIRGMRSGISTSVTAESLQDAGWAWLHDRQRTSYGSAAYVFAHLGIDHAWFLGELARRSRAACRARRVGAV